MREDLNRTLVPCGHITESVLTPTNCPGETPPNAYTSDPLINDAWIATHNEPSALLLPDACLSHWHYSTPHANMGFRTRVYVQTHHFVRLDFNTVNPITRLVRRGRAFDGNYTALLDDGKIREIVITRTARVTFHLS